MKTTMSGKRQNKEEKLEWVKIDPAGKNRVLRYAENSSITRFK